MQKQIENYIKSGRAGLNIVTAEEQRVEALIRAVAKSCVKNGQPEFGVFVWSCTSGIINAETKEQLGKADPIEMLDGFMALPEKSILVCRDFHQFMADGNPLITRKVKDALVLGKQSNRVLIVIGCRMVLPPELEKEITVIDFKLPTREELLPVLQGVAGSAGIALNGNTELLLDAASGLTSIEAEDAFALSVVEAKDILPAIIAREKSNTVRKNGLLEIVDVKPDISAVGGLENAKAWLIKRSSAFSKQAKAYGLPVPKGVMGVGIPGCGKSLLGKTTANILNVPLLKLDAGKIFGSLVGESERNLRAVIQTAEAVAPCVLMVDEIEKGFSGTKSSGATDGGTTARVFGSFLQWMNDKTAPVFVFATANDITALPPEFLRKGRFDEIFFFDLPDELERVDIWAIHIGLKKRKAEDYDLAALSKITEGWTGAEIEALYTEALFSAFSDNREPDTALLASLSKDTVPLSKMMAAEVESLRQWSNGHARRASAPKTVEIKQGRKMV